MFPNTFGKLRQNNTILTRLSNILVYTEINEKIAFKCSDLGQQRYLQKPWFRPLLTEAFRREH